MQGESLQDLMDKQVQLNSDTIWDFAYQLIDQISKWEESSTSCHVLPPLIYIDGNNVQLADFGKMFQMLPQVKDNKRQKDQEFEHLECFLAPVIYAQIYKGSNVFVEYHKVSVYEFGITILKMIFPFADLNKTNTFQGNVSLKELLAYIDVRIESNQKLSEILNVVLIYEQENRCDFIGLKELFGILQIEVIDPYVNSYQVDEPYKYVQPPILNQDPSPQLEKQQLDLPYGKYDGQVRDWKPNGYGILTLINGNTLIGCFVDGKLDGYGKTNNKNGETHEGGYKNGLFHGKGVHKTATGDKYDGEFVQNMRDGWGTLEMAKGSKYEGQFKNNKPNGQGTFTDSKGNSKSGEFENGRLIKK